MVETLEIMGCLPPFSTGDPDFAGPSTVFGPRFSDDRFQVELLAQRLRDQVDSSGREGNATAAWLRSVRRPPWCRNAVAGSFCWMISGDFSGICFTDGIMLG